MNNRDKDRLLDSFDRLDSADRQALVAFAEFLCHRQGDETGSAAVEAPCAIPRPVDETVPAALKRLKASYEMLDASDLLGEAAELMSQHVVQGKQAHEIIDALETLFQRHYQNYQSEQKQ